MPKVVFYVLMSAILCIFFSCSSRPSKIDVMRQEKMQKDSIKYMQALQNMHYSDSLLQTLTLQADSLIMKFKYQKNEKAEDHGHYVHKLLLTTVNTFRNCLQACVDDNNKVRVQSYYYGVKRHYQRGIRLYVNANYVEKEGSNHVFETEGWHEILTIDGEDALQVLAFVYNCSGERIRVKSIGDQNVEYVLTQSEKQALSDTYQLAVLMRNIDALERSVHVTSLQIQKYEKSHAKYK